MRRSLALLLVVFALGAFAAPPQAAFAAPPSGPPDLTWPDGSRYWGALRFDRPNGRGYLSGADGRWYEGDFVDGKFHGQGFMHLPNGDEYRGAFVNGYFDGPGKLEDSARQRALLDDALARLLPSQPGRISLYLLAVGGDASQEVFRREVEYVRNQFDRDFGTRGRSLALVNSRTTVATLPMATFGNIREAIQAIAARMDLDNDILFLFMTSHGAKDHEFKLTQGGMSLRGVKPKELAGLLEESRIRWKVVLVSACYSGGFVAPLKSANTMVITAARADRTSFGCADENDFTYFGRAFFKEALPASGSFFDAFTRAQALVSEWEKKDKTPEAERSLPQIHSPALLSEQLKKWWAQARR